jgi:hypothetical protein
MLKRRVAMRIRWILLISLFTLVLAGCGGSAAPPGQSQDPGALSPQELFTETPSQSGNPIQLVSTEEAATMPSISLSADKFIQIATKDLASRLKIDIQQISVVEAVEFTWPNAALGCPSPDKVYATVKVPGYRVRLNANGNEYRYNMDQTGQFVLCADPSSDDSDPQNPITPNQTQPVNPGVPIK